MSVLLLVRHAAAGSRRSWSGPDHLRPLDERGERQASALPSLVAGFVVDRVLSSPAVRCVATVSPLAAVRGLAVEPSPALHEGRSDDALALVVSLLAAGADAVLCSHGDVIPDVLDALSGDGWSIPDHRPCAKGSTWVLADRRGSYLPPPPA